MAYRVIVVTDGRHYKRGDQVRWFDRQHRVWVNATIVNEYHYPEELEDEDLRAWWVRDDYDVTLLLYESQFISDVQ